MSDLETLEAEINTAIAGADSEAALEDVRVAALGKKGSVSEKMKTLGKMSPEERKEMGPALNGLKNRVGEAIAARKEVLKEEALNARLASETVDVSQPLRTTPAEEGRIHPISQVTDELIAIFATWASPLLKARTSRQMS